MGGNWNYEPDFQGCLDIEAEGSAIFEQYIKSKTDWTAIRIKNQTIQTHGIDYILKGANDQEYSVELKTEASDKYGNLFLEVCSNVKPYRAGWLYTAQCDYLGYVFVDNQTLYLMDFPRLYSWYWDNINRFEVKEQRKYRQHNRVLGVPVPIETLKSELGVKVVNLI